MNGGEHRAGTRDPGHREQEACLQGVCGQVASSPGAYEPHQGRCGLFQEQWKILRLGFVRGWVRQGRGLSGVGGLFRLEHGEQITEQGAGVGGPTGEFLVAPQLRQEKIAARMTVSVDRGGCDESGQKLMSLRGVQKVERIGHGDGWLDREVKKFWELPRLMV